MHGLESLPAVVCEDHPQQVLSRRAEPERDPGIIAERRGQREAADRLVSVEDVHLAQVEGVPRLDELPLPGLQARSARMLGLDLDVDRLVRADAAFGDQLRYPDRGRTDLVGARPAWRRRGPRTATAALRDRDGPRAVPANVAAALGRRHDVGGATIEADLEGEIDLAVQRREVGDGPQGDGVALVHDADAAPVVARV